MVSFNAAETSVHRACWLSTVLSRWRADTAPIFILQTSPMLGRISQQISLTSGEPSQVTAPWGCCHAPKMRWKGHSKCWQFLRNSTCCLQSQPRDSPTDWGKTHCHAPSTTLTSPQDCVSSLCWCWEAAVLPGQLHFQPFHPPLVSWDILHHQLQPLFAAALAVSLLGRGGFVCSLRPTLCMSRRIFGKIKHLNYVGAAWLFLKAVSVLSVIFLQKTCARWLYMAAVLLRAKWRPHAEAPLKSLCI